MIFPTFQRHFVVVAITALLLAACGGGGSGVSGNDAEEVPPSSDGDTGEVARVTYGTVPEYSAGTSNVHIVGATNRGLYVEDQNSQGGTRIHKLHGNPLFADWSSVDLGSEWALSVRPSNRYSEAEGEFSFYYATSEHVGRYTINTGGISRQWANDRYIRTVESGPQKGVYTGPWGIGGSINGDYKYVYHDDNAYTTSSAVSNMFTNPIGPTESTNPSEAYFGIQDALGRPDDLELFVATRALAGGGINELRVYSGLTMTREALPGETDASVSDLQWYDGKLWLLVGDKVYSRDKPNVFVAKAQVSLTLGSFGSFCIKGGEILASDGYATSVFNGKRRNYISRGSLSVEQQIQAALLQGTLSAAGVHCSPDNSSAVVYTQGDAFKHPGTIAMIEILN